MTTSSVERPPVVRVTIDSPGPTVTIEACEPLTVVAETAQRLWSAAAAEHYARRGRRGLEAGAMGFDAPIRNTPTVQPSSMDWAPGPYPIQPPAGPQ